MARNKIHLMNDLPHYYEIEDMLEFCRRYDHLYICGADENQEHLLKFFDICGIKIDGYTLRSLDGQCQLQYRQIPILAVDEVIRKPNTGIILALPDQYYRQFIPKFRAEGFSNYFIMTEYNKRTIANQLKPRPIEEMTFEINLADHCNISCQMCDHFSQLSEKHLVDKEAFERDIKRMGDIFNHKIACVTLLGGEPLLHPDVISFASIVRSEFPDAEVIILTNGLLLPKLENMPDGGNIWQACKDLNVQITVTIYPLKFDYAALEQKAEEYGVKLVMSSDIHAAEFTKTVKISIKHPFDLSGNIGKEYFPACLYFNKFNVLKDGRYYMCPVSANIGIFNKKFGQNLQLTNADSLDIYKINDWHEFAQFAANYIPFCRYCDLKNWQAHSPWKASSNSIEEYV